MIRTIIFLILLNSIFIFPFSINAKSSYQAQTITSFNDVVWGFSFINENEFLATLRKGELYYYNVKTKEKVKLNTPVVKAGGQGGLLDVYIHTKAGKKYVYLTYSEKYGGEYTTSLARGIYKNKTLLGLTTIFRAKVKGNTSRHFGSRVLIKNNHLFMTIGDRGKRKYAQNLSFHNGKILRLTLDGKPATDNPFTSKKNVLPEIWSLGHRNPQGIDLDIATGNIYSVEFGPKGGDELNLIKRSQNYGWPVITYGKEYYGLSIGKKSQKGMEQPLTYWVPSISPSGMAFYKSNKLPKWKNHLFIAALGSQHLRRLKITNGKVVEQEVLFKSLNERVRQVQSGPDGWLYFSTDSGKIMQVQPFKEL